MIFVKLGGSLITDKATEETAREEVIHRLANELARALNENPSLRILLGHGSGSFGHPVAKRYQTQTGASSPEEWIGFTEVWHAANKLNRIVVDELRAVGLPAISFPPSASSTSFGGEITDLAVEPIRRAIESGLLPVVQGDVSFDSRTGSTILSTEMVFRFLAPVLQPDLVLLAGIEPGVYTRHPAEGEVLASVTGADISKLNLGPAATPDVTGGMANKVVEALSISEAIPGLSVRIFSGMEPNSLYDALQGTELGTLVKYSLDS